MIHSWVWGILERFGDKHNTKGTSSVRAFRGGVRILRFWNGLTERKRGEGDSRRLCETLSRLRGKRSGIRQLPEKAFTRSQDKQFQPHLGRFYAYWVSLLTIHKLLVFKWSIVFKFGIILNDTEKNIVEVNKGVFLGKTTNAFILVNCDLGVNTSRILTIQQGSERSEWASPWMEQASLWMKGASKGSVVKQSVVERVSGASERT